MNPPPTLLASYQQAASYPSNLLALHRPIDTARCRQYEQRLNNPACRLCLDDPSESGKLQVSFRDWVRGDPACRKQNVFNDNELADWLGDQSPAGSHFTQIDPLCRFIFLSARTGRDALKLTTKMLRRLMSYHQVPAQYLDFLFLFGQRETASDLKFGTFWSDSSSLGSPRADLVSSTLGRSGRHYEMCFNLKGAEPREPAIFSPTEPDQWSVRHAAVYHKFDAQTGAAVWTITKATWTMKDLFRDATGDGSEPTARTFDTPASSYCSSLAAHLLIARSATENWRPYLQCLEDSLEEKTKTVKFSSDDRTTSKDIPYTIYSRSDVQDIICYEEMATQATYALETNVKVLQDLSEFYQALMTDTDFTLSTEDRVIRATRSFAADIHKIQAETQNMLSRANHLLTHAMGRRQLILNLMQAQNADNMSEMTVRSIKEAITMRIITVVTLLYLPATFVSTFFSTDVVKYQPGNDGEPYHTQYSSLAMDRWLQVTLPLTVITMIIAFGLYLKKVRPLKKLEQSKV